MDLCRPDPNLVTPDARQRVHDLPEVFNALALVADKFSAMGGGLAANPAVGGGVVVKMMARDLRMLLRKVAEWMPQPCAAASSTTEPFNRLRRVEPVQATTGTSDARNATCTPPSIPLGICLPSSSL